MFVSSQLAADINYLGIKPLNYWRVLLLFAYRENIKTQMDMKITALH